MVSSLGHSIETAVADLVDNSIQHGASYFRFGFYYDDLRPDNSFVYFFDNGNGMSESELKNAMTIGSLQQKDKISIHSKFGLGLKIASLNNCDSFQVFTKKSGKFNSLKMSYDETKENLLISNDTLIPSRLNNIFPNYENEKKGTLIIWNNLKKNKFKAKNHSDFFSISTRVQSHLMIVFNRYIQTNRISIYYNEDKLNYLDPTTPGLNTFKGDVKKIKINNSAVEIIPYIVPSDEDYNLSREDVKKTRNFLINNPLDGILFYRNDRLIDFGKWCEVIPDSLRSKNLKNIKRIRIVVNFDASLDRQFSLEPTKSELELPIELRPEIYDCFDKLFKKLSTQTKQNLVKQEMVTKNKDLWRIKNGKPVLNFECDEIKNLANKKNEFIDLLKKIENSIPMIITHNINIKDISMSEGTLMNKAINAISALSNNGYEISDSIELISSRRPFVFEEGLRQQLKEHFDVR